MLTQVETKTTLGPPGPGYYPQEFGRGDPPAENQDKLWRPYGLKGGLPHLQGILGHRSKYLKSGAGREAGETRHLPPGEGLWGWPLYNIKLCDFQKKYL